QREGFGLRARQARLSQFPCASGRGRAASWRGAAVRLVGRNDTTLAAALIVGTFILFHQPLEFLMSAAADGERQYHIDLVQSLFVLGTVFAFHQFRKRQETKSELAAAAMEARQARLRTEELERLVGFSRSLSGATDFKSLNQILTRHLPRFTR